MVKDLVRSNDLINSFLKDWVNNFIDVQKDSKGIGRDLVDFSLELIKDLIDFARVGKKLNRFLEDFVRSPIDFSKNSQGFGMDLNGCPKDLVMNLMISEGVVKDLVSSLINF